MFNKFPKRTGIYHVKDNIGRLQVRVRFRRVNSLLQLPKFDYEKNVLQRDAFDVSGCDRGEQTVQTMHWQQKIFSVAEVEFYSDERNCVTDTQKKYHQWLKTEDGAGRTNGRDRRTKKRSKKPPKSKIATKKEAKGSEIFSYVQEDNFMPAGERSEKDDPTSKNVHVMYIYAALEPDTQLVALRWYPDHRMLHVYPDFNGYQDDPYFIEIDSDYRHLYAYTVENASQWREADSITKNLLSYLHLPGIDVHWKIPKERLTAEFDIPPGHASRVVLLFEISDAENCDYANVHVRYHVHLPAGTILEEGLQRASTHSASPASYGHGDPRCHFGYGWQMTLLCEETFNPGDLLHVYFELISIDSWDRERIEGYAHYSCHLQRPGRDAMRLQCVRPVDGFMAALNRFFIGGRQQFDYVTFFTPPSGASLSLHSRYRQRIQNTGTLSVKCQRFTQRNCELLRPCRTGRVRGMTLDDIVTAYSEACKRLEAALRERET